MDHHGFFRGGRNEDEVDHGVEYDAARYIKEGSVLKKSGVPGSEGFLIELCQPSEMGLDGTDGVSKSRGETSYDHPRGQSRDARKFCAITAVDENETHAPEGR